MGMVSIPTFSALQSISIPRDYHSFKAKVNSYQLQLLNNTNVLKAYSSIWTPDKHPKLRTFLLKSDQAFSVQPSVRTWEDPDDGSGSESEEEKEHDLGFQSEWEEDDDKVAPAPAAVTADVDRSTTSAYEEQLVRGILSPFYGLLLVFYDS
jgi:hypothetical protein